MQVKIREQSAKFLHSVCHYYCTWTRVTIVGHDVTSIYHLLLFQPFADSGKALCACLQLVYMYIQEFLQCEI